MKLIPEGGEGTKGKTKKPSLTWSQVPHYCQLQKIPEKVSWLSVHGKTSGHWQKLQRYIF
jgi:hypothetical protein